MGSFLVSHYVFIFACGSILNIPNNNKQFDKHTIKTSYCKSI